VYVDPAVVVDAASFGIAADIAAGIGAVLGRNDVDVVVLNRASPLLYHRVLRDGVRLVARDLAATTVREGRALSRYCDYVPHLRKIEAVHRARIASGSFGR
jgi:predicted nucleotidyltransferase